MSDEAILTVMTYNGAATSPVLTMSCRCFIMRMPTLSAFKS